MGKLLFSFLFILPIHLVAQISTGARYSALGNSTAALMGLEALAGNPAGITSVPNVAASLSFKNEWLSAPIQTNVLLLLPSKLAHGGLAAGIYETGGDFRELQMAGTLGRRVNDRFSAGVRVNYRQLSFPGLDASTGLVSADLGIQYQLRRHWVWGLEMVNPFNLSRKHGQGLPIYKLGTHFSFSSQTSIALQTAYSARYGSDVTLGLEYGAWSWLLLRGGLSVNPFVHSVGAGVLIKRFVVDGAMRIHPQLGLSPQISLGYAL